MEKSFLISKNQFQTAWDAPLSFKFLIGHFVITVAGGFAILLFYQFIFYLLFYTGWVGYLFFIGTSTLTLLTVFLLQIPVFKKFYQLNYLHYCKSLLIGQIYVLGLYIFVLVWSYHYWLPNQLN